MDIRNTNFELRFKTPYESIEFGEEYNGGEKITESVGYRTAKQQIEEMLLAGQRLDSYRRGDLLYDYDEGDFDTDFEEDLPFDRMRDLDFAYASQLQYSLDEKFRNAETSHLADALLDVNRPSDTDQVSPLSEGKGEKIENE